jgi:hypothetical protein
MLEEVANMVASLENKDDQRALADLLRFAEITDYNAHKVWVYFPRYLF